MSSIILFDTAHQQLLPLTYAKPVSELRIGILTIKEKWEKRLNASISFKTEDYLQEKYSLKITHDNLIINSSLVANDAITKEIKSLELNEALVQDSMILAIRLDGNDAKSMININELGDKVIAKKSQANAIQVTRPYHIFSHNAQALQDDFDLLTKGRTSQSISETNTVLGKENIFLEKGAKVECAILNATSGPIYVGKNAEIMEGCIVRGGLGMCENSVLKMGAKIYGATTLGVYCKVGGEINNSVLQAYSNKGHDGFLGNSVIGEWCNLGADTNNSNLKNNYAPVKLWDYTTGRFGLTGLQFCGLIMGDHSKCGINTMFNTGTVVGFSSNIYGAGFPRNFIPSFAWGGTSGYMTFRMKKALEVAERMMGRRKQVLSEADIKIFEYISQQTIQYRSWEK
jgi:UDP-N-acetylglucosamine diphosphorylase/glucosamine-1-phosphate N-acetyltransferase